MLKKLLGLVAAAYLLGACASEPPPPPPPPPAPPPPQAFMVFFDWDSTRLSPASLNVLEQAGDAFKAKQAARVTATGHTDTTGTEAYNMALSLRRANAVKDALVKLGVPAAAITTVGRGEAGLLVQTGDGVREPQNRRVEITIPQMASAPPMNDQAYCAQLAGCGVTTTAHRSGPGPAGDRQVRRRRLCRRHPDAREAADRRQDPAASAHLISEPGSPVEEGGLPKGGRLFHACVSPSCVGRPARCRIGSASDASWRAAGTGSIVPAAGRWRKLRFMRS